MSFSTGRRPDFPDCAEILVQPDRITLALQHHTLPRTWTCHLTFPSAYHPGHWDCQLKPPFHTHTTSPDFATAIGRGVGLWQAHRRWPGWEAARSLYECTLTGFPFTHRKGAHVTGQMALNAIRAALRTSPRQPAPSPPRLARGAFRFPGGGT